MSETAPNPPPSQGEAKQRAIDSFQRWITTVWREPVICPVCKSWSWTTGEPLDLPSRHTMGRGHTVMPVSCDTCAHTMFFNLVTAGIYDGVTGEPRSPDEVVPPPAIELPSSPETS
jgi:hypothetical protein